VPLPGNDPYMGTRRAARATASSCGLLVI
jgi:hypothetical protein